MSLLTPPTQDSIIDRLAVEWMATVLDPTNVVRIAKAAEIVQAGSVERTARPGRYLVVSQSHPDEAYMVDHGTCHCPDAAKRDSRNCKHAWAVRLFAAVERAEVDAEQLTVRVDPEDSILDLWPIADGEPCELTAPTVGTITVLPLPAELEALSAELFG